MGIGARAGSALAIVALFSTANTVLVLLLSASRLIFGMANEGALPSGLARVGRTQTPWVATLVVAGGSLLVVFGVADLGRVANLTNVAIFATFLAINAAVIRLRFKEPQTPRPFRTPLALGGVPVIPVLGIVSVLGLAVQVDRVTLGQCGVLLLVGGLLHVLRTRRQASAQ